MRRLILIFQGLNLNNCNFLETKSVIYWNSFVLCSHPWIMPSATSAFHGCLEQFLLDVLLDISLMYLLKGYLENTEKERIKRLVRFKPPTEFWMRSPINSWSLVDGSILWLRGKSPNFFFTICELCNSNYSVNNIWLRDFSCVWYRIELCWANFCIKIFSILNIGIL